MQNLSVVLMMVMLLVFLVDQTQQRCCPLFQAAGKKRGHNKRSLWEKMRNLFDAFVFVSMQELYEAIINGVARQQPDLQDSSIGVGKVH